MFFKKSIFIPFDLINHFTGGPKTFLQNLKQGLDNKKFPYIDNPNTYKKSKQIFFPISYDVNILELFKSKKKRIIQRLDGVYYYSKHGDKYKELNKDLEIIYKTLSNIIIFQSEYSKEQCYEVLGKPIAEYKKIIINGANTSIFYPKKEKQFIKSHPIFITTGNFRNIDMIEPLILALDNVTFNFSLVIVGRVDKKLNKYLDRPYIIHKDYLSAIEISEELRKADIFLYSHLNPPCPNSVIEAICCGLPVVGFNSGAMEELCFFNEDLFAYVSDDVLQKYEDFNSEKLRDKIKLCVSEYNKYRDNAIKYTNYYTLDKMIDEYIEVFNSCNTL